MSAEEQEKRREGEGEGDRMNVTLAQLKGHACTAGTFMLSHKSTPYIRPKRSPFRKIQGLVTAGAEGPRKPASAEAAGTAIR